MSSARSSQHATGAPDTANPHPERKAPALLHDDTLIAEFAAVILYLTTWFSDAGLAPKACDPQYGADLTWLFWYDSVMEPVLITEAAGLSVPICCRLAGTSGS